ncbi:hypothetical protein LOAG_03590 [Loa loa]|uniref:Purine-nucleoside phosphorylase n=1 Tax=Loa loa TaxID=7209 RepID=A0A1S0U4C1_LOALO|nr:hypothetical protein LOAG_03590 [Loa loa]EFO24900.1 hypothetical protein LOAG_03590 [Loa loa]
MSIYHELIIAYQMGMRVFGCSLITILTNLNSENSVVMTHEEVMEARKETLERTTNFICEIVKNL